MNRPTRKRLRLENRRIYSQDGRIFFLTICTRSKRRVFENLDLGRLCVDSLQKIARRRGNPVYAYCLMPDHVHLVVGATERSNLTGFVQSWKSACTAIWRDLGGESSFWQRSFYDRAQRHHDDLRATCRYVLANPVRAGLVKEWREYPLSGSLVWEL